MQRRNALQSIALGLGGSLLMPSWANAWTPKSIKFNAQFSKTEITTISDLVNAIIPKTDTPGAKELGVQDFLMRMIQDCTVAKDQESYKNGLSKFEEFCQSKYLKSFAQIDKTQQMAVLKEISEGPDSPLKSMLNITKRYTIQGYTNSEYFLTNVAKFEFAPGRFNGCVDIKI